MMKNEIAAAIRTAFLSSLMTQGIASAGQFQGNADNPWQRAVHRTQPLQPSSRAPNYRPKDADEEQKLCGWPSMTKRLVCVPKTWSTSPGTIVYDIGKSKYNGNPVAFESEYCPKQRALKGKIEGIDKVASFKQSVNGQFHQRTSATYLPSVAALLPFLALLEHDRRCTSRRYEDHG